MREKQLETICIKLAEVNASIATSGVALTTFIEGNPTRFSLAMFGVCGAMLSYNAYQIYQDEKAKREPQKVKRYSNNIQK